MGRPMAWLANAEVQIPAAWTIRLENLPRLPRWSCSRARGSAEPPRSQGIVLRKHIQHFLGGFAASQAFWIGWGRRVSLRSHPDGEFAAAQADRSRWRAPEIGHNRRRKDGSIRVLLSLRARPTPSAKCS